ncbi:hypothetical protein JR316_0005705 [Psilocybe cubensis]|uniref:Uncharacterized protein n=2 Tax=Psilocybe cubensis TaxID=181762 RepID=A0A8H7Y2H0_PSICU|nr:hypothetical protein JR316_0005705 [Psilocybe cubensis]KAH9481185.1 hypothetical protein JR316_0005705 [Psilocybe cubensis]
MISFVDILPSDIILTIIDGVASMDDDASTNLKACSLTCKSFLQHCRKHIFHSITLDIIDGSTCRLFRDLIESAPWVPDYVRVLEVTPISHYYDMSDEEEAAFKKINNLHTLVIRPDSIFGLDWRMLPPTTLDVLIHLIQLPTIVNLKLMTFLTFNPAYLIPCTGLKRLCFRNSNLKYSEYDIHLPQNQDDSINAFSSGIFPPLLPDALDTDSFTALSLKTLIEPQKNHLNPIMDINMVKKIDFKFHPSADAGSCMELFGYMKGLSIIHFKLSQPPHTSAIVPSIIASKSLDTLHTLRIYLEFQDHWVPQICEVLKELAGQSRITTLVLASILFPSDSGSERLEDWTPIADIFLSKGDWRYLRRLEINFHNTVWDHFDPGPEQIHFEDAVRRTYEVQLAKLSEISTFQYNLTITGGRWYEDLGVSGVF